MREKITDTVFILKVSNDQKKWLEKMAFQTHQSQAAIVRAMIDKELSTRPATNAQLQTAN